MVKATEYFIICNKNLKRAALGINEKEKYWQIKELHQEIAKEVQKGEKLTIRALEELTFNQYAARDINELKATVAQLENFFLLYNPNNKYDICQYW